MLAKNILVFLSFLTIASPVFAQAYMKQTIERRLNEANSYFQQNDYEMGANRIREACSLMQSAPQAMPQANYIQVAASKVEFMEGKLAAAMDKRDYDAAKQIAAAEDILLTSLTNWDARNPRWHYQRAVLFQMSSGIPMTGAGAAMASRLGIQNNMHNEINMQPLHNAVQECDAVLGQPDQSYRDKASKLKAACQTEIQRRTNKMNAFSKEYYRKLPKGMPQPGVSGASDTSPAEHYCSKCGGGHSSWICPFTHGG